MIVIAQSGCAGGGSCPDPVPMSSLPDSIVSRIDPTRHDRASVSRAAPGDPDSDLVVRLSAQDAVRPSLRGPDEPVVVEMTKRGEHWTVPLTTVSVAGVEHTTDFKIDTGAHTQLALDSGTARRLGVVTPGELPEGVTHTAFGPKKVRSGVVSEVRLGSATLGPVEVEVECSGRSYTPLIGIRLLEQFGHAIFDWDSGQLTLLPRGWSARTQHGASDPGWTTVAWDASPVSLRRDSIEHEGDGRRRVLVEMASRWVRLNIDGQSRVTLIDTGFSGDLFSFEPLDAESVRTGSVVGQGFGRRGTFRTELLASPVEIGTLEVEGLTLIEPSIDHGNMSLVHRAGFEIMVGLGVLERFPLWLDFERDEIRMWTGEGMTPGVIASEEED